MRKPWKVQSEFITGVRTQAGRVKYVNSKEMGMRRHVLKIIKRETLKIKGELGK